MDCEYVDADLVLIEHSWTIFKRKISRNNSSSMKHAPSSNSQFYVQVCLSISLSLWCIRLCLLYVFFYLDKYRIFIIRIK